MVQGRVTGSETVQEMKTLLGKDFLKEPDLVTVLFQALARQR